ncbi:hypothetical protein CANARDRAFT_30590 [[Candida] arabinofermentans NRRL YB-2248]|uniref:BZIP domain-containing protein n=1 Tax=[Candida] arabinofermentans NRRL YB-2248 TaxID=983967 RepID=A0A1E4STC3_9ASCO|nr:hypothetical protein CANARDRAFT_30590 [[Candida] arabinofermentans NRRL YB-2248]
MTNPNLSAVIMDENAVIETMIAIEKPNADDITEQAPLKRLGSTKKNQNAISMENFHLEPQDFQSFLMMNPPILEYSTSFLVNQPPTNNSTNSQFGFNYPSSPMSYNNATLSSNIQAGNTRQTSQPSEQTGFVASSNAHSFQANAVPFDSHQINDFSSDFTNTQQQQQDLHHQQQQQQYFMPQYQPGAGFPDMANEQQNILPNQSFHHPQLRRRVSISNGQIGQISMMYHKNESKEHDDMQISDPDNLNLQQQDLQQQHLIHSNPFQSQSPIPSAVPLFGTTNDPTLKLQVEPTIQLKKSQPQLKERINNKIKQRTNANKAKQMLPATNITLEDNEDIKVNSNGIPQHQLIYNNEVIFNPNNGPIPGTSAWKKQKILERNRVAASKCRQKKKVLQEKLQQDIDKSQMENRLLMKKNKYLEEKLFAIKSELSNFLKTHPSATLAPFANLTNLFQLQEANLYLEFKAAMKLSDGEDADDVNGDNDDDDDADDDEDLDDLEYDTNDPSGSTSVTDENPDTQRDDDRKST